ERSWYESFCLLRALFVLFFFFFSSRRRHTRFSRDWSSDVCSSDLTRLNSQSGPHPDGIQYREQGDLFHSWYTSCRIPFRLHSRHTQPCSTGPAARTAPHWAH